MVPYAGLKPPILVGPALCRAEPSKSGAGAPTTAPGMGGVAPLVERVKATPPLRGLNETKLGPGCGAGIDLLITYMCCLGKFAVWPLWAPSDPCGWTSRYR